MPAEQLQLFASLDFPGRSTLMIWEIASRLGVTVRHLLNQIDSGALVVLDLKDPASSRRCARVPIECYRAYIARQLTGPVDVRSAFIRTLPPVERRALIRELEASLKPSTQHV
jgi:hypothetical protein